MIVRWRALVAFAIVSLSLSSAGSAHHGQVGLFDQNKVVELKGSVKEWNFVNPHPILVLEVTDQTGTTQWDVYFGPSAVSFMKRQGFTRETFKPGDAIVVKGHPATTAVKGLDVWGKETSVMRADGTKLP
jgi:hypothetical protein